MKMMTTMTIQTKPLTWRPNCAARRLHPGWSQARVRTRKNMQNSRKHVKVLRISPGKNAWKLCRK